MSQETHERAEQLERALCRGLELLEAGRPEEARRVLAAALPEAMDLREVGGEGKPEALSAAFATPTMAELLERQGDTEGASRIRAQLAGAGAPEPLRPPSRQRVIGTLERWLENLRLGARA